MPASNMIAWWKSLDKKWKNVFIRMLHLREGDTPTEKEITNLWATKNLDLSFNLYVKNRPVQTPIKNITPLEVFTQLETLKLFGNSISDFTPL